MRLAYYAGASTAAAAACLLKAFHERPNFYSATVYLSQSNACLLILTNLLLMCACAFIYALQRLLYGPLRPIEIEQLSEKAWYAVLDTLLAMPSFREDVGGWLLTMFVLLLAGKVWGWIGEGRVDILEQQPPANPRLFHARLANSLIFSVIFDIWMTRYCFETVAADPKPGMMVIFTFEFAILTVFSTFTLCRYLLSLVSIVISKQQMVKAIEDRKTEIQAERAAARQNEAEGESVPQPEEPIEVDENEVDVPGWEEKRRWLFGLEMTADFLKLLLYIIFFTVSITFNGLPMHIMRDVYMTFASFTKRLGDYMNYKKATSDMNARYPDATTAEIRDDACIICREDMIAWQDPAAAEPEAASPRARRDEGLRAKKLPCGHILHLRCLKAWLERQQVCPTCRRPVIAATTPAANIAQANPAPVAANDAPAAAQNALGQRPANQNRARFFNLGPLRIGLLNGPAGQMDNIVNQLRGVQPPQGQAGNVQPAPAAAATATQVQPPGIPTQALATQDARLSQTELAQISQRVLREANMLNLEQSQLNTIRAMTQELERLTSLHQYNATMGRVAQAVPQAHQHQNIGIPNANILPPVANQVLTGHHSQAIAAGGQALPPGMVLPDGWTLMPLQRQINQHGGFLGQRSAHANPHLTVEPVEAASASATAAPTNVATPAATVPPLPAELSNSLTSPTDDAGSPLFVPVAASSSAQNLSSAEPAATCTSISTGADTVQSEAIQRTPWAAENWDFNAAAEQSSDEQSPQEAARDKGKGRAVEVEDVPDNQE